MNHWRENIIFVKSERNKQEFTIAVSPFIIISHLIIFKTKNSSFSIYRGNQNTHYKLNKPFSENCGFKFMLNKFFLKIGPSMRQCGKVCNSLQATDNSILQSMVYACCITENKSHTQIM